jgi:hypothetical protein
MKEKKIDLSTETKIKEAARVVFYKKVFSNQDKGYCRRSRDQSCFAQLLFSEQREAF